MESTLEVQMLAPADWRVLRRVRLEALLESPQAFTSNHAEEERWGELEWRRALHAATWIVAREAQKVIGLAKSVGGKRRSASRHIESVWVSPTHRRRGVFRALIHALADMERRMGAADLLLWVLEDNHDARLAYLALGFEPTGDRQLLPDLERFEERLRLGLHRRVEM
jgi:GNAT superfamily N-acetyltransferase